MNRRKAILQTAGLLGGSLVASPLLLNGCAGETATGAITPMDIPFWDEVAETILPVTSDSGGAKAAGIGAFMQVIVKDCYDDEEAERFHSGMRSIEERAESEYGAGFMTLTPEERFELIDAIDREAKATEDHAFTMIKDHTLWGYFSSEVGCQEALRYNPIPGRYEGCIPYHNEPAWAG